MASDIETMEFVHCWQSLRPCTCGGQPKVRYMAERVHKWDRPDFYWLVECPKCGKQVTSAVSQTALFAWNGQN